MCFNLPAQVERIGAPIPQVWSKNVPRGTLDRCAFGGGNRLINW